MSEATEDEVNQGPGNVQQQVVITGQAESVAFAVVTLVLYLLVVTAPIAFVLNVVGLFTGPRQGCFVAMIALVMLPYVALVGLLIAVGGV